LFDISIDHAKSIIILCENGIFSSAYALARPMFECYVRASWLQNCATEEQISKIKEKDIFPLKLGQMIEVIEAPDDMPKALTDIPHLFFINRCNFNISLFCYYFS